ncbi:MAG TPA: HNH endonuclease [Pyrinomonadaceae bacterium]
MNNEIISHMEMCIREKTSLQRGMNYKLGGTYSVILMSTRKNAPYLDKIIEDGTVLIYEGHNISKNHYGINPKEADQPEKNFTGNLTQNGKFHKAARDFKAGLREAELVKVYEKIRDGIWSYNGIFELIDSWIEDDGKRNVFKFKLTAIEEVDLSSDEIVIHERRRIIPTEIKLEVWKRDEGKCVTCGVTDELHFDHILPFSKGGTSIKPENVQLLCARHNLEKSDKIL